MVSATILGDTDVDVEITVRQQLREWYGNSVEDWRLLHRFSIEHALPVQDPFLPLDQPTQVAEGLYVCGDYRDTPSLQGAMLSGRRVAEAIAKDWEID